MTDPRIGMGFEVDLRVTGPYEVRAATSSDGGSLDVAIVARRVVGGERIVIGEIWAACPSDGSEEKVRLDAVEVASDICAKLNSFCE